jgi:hypothetical protein
MTLASRSVVSNVRQYKIDLILEISGSHRVLHEDELLMGYCACSRVEID